MNKGIFFWLRWQIFSTFASLSTSFKCSRRIMCNATTEIWFVWTLFYGRNISLFLLSQAYVFTIRKCISFQLAWENVFISQQSWSTANRQRTVNDSELLISHKKVSERWVHFNETFHCFNFYESRQLFSTEQSRKRQLGGIMPKNSRKLLKLNRPDGLTGSQTYSHSSLSKAVAHRPFFLLLSVPPFVDCRLLQVFCETRNLWDSTWLDEFTVTTERMLWIHLARTHLRERWEGKEKLKILDDDDDAQDDGASENFSTFLLHWLKGEEKYSHERISHTSRFCFQD